MPQPTHRPARVAPPRTILSALVLAAALALALDASALAPAQRVADRAGDVRGPLDLRAVAVAQDGPDLVVVARTGGRFSSAALVGRDGRSLCLLLARPRGPARRALCLVARHGRPRIELRGVSASGRQVPERLVAARIARPSARVVRIRLAPAAAGLGRGPFAWRFVTTWRDRGPCARGCVDYAPSRGFARGVVRRPRLAGCVARAPWLVSSGSRAGRRVAFGIDDGPSAYTDAMLGVLRRHRARATFFEVGSEVGGRGAIMRRVLAEGSTIGDHSWSHPVLSGGGPLAAGQIARTAAAIVAQTGWRPCLMRPPYGASSGALVAVARRQGMVTVDWDVDPRDWARPGTGAIVSRVLSALRPGGIVVMHDGGGPRQQSVAAMGSILGARAARHVRAVPVEELLGLRYLYR